MKTADFLPATAFLDHLDRRRTRPRVLILAAAVLGCGVMAGAFALEAGRVETQAVEAERPDTAALQAGQELSRIYAEMNDYAIHLDPLSEHLSRPTVGWILKDIAHEVGAGVQIEEIGWRYQAGTPGAKDGLDRGRVGLDLVTTVRGRSNLLELDGRLQTFTRFAAVEPGRQEVVRGSEDEIRFELRLLDTLPARPRNGGSAR